MMQLLLISNSTMPGEAYLDYPKSEIKDFLGDKVKKALFIPYAAVTFSFDEYEAKVADRFNELGYEVTGIHRFEDPIKAIKEADSIVVGGGNTWQLVRMLHEQQLMPAIREKVENGTPYIGWSAGSNVACPFLKTTNDMPIVDPLGFDCCGLIPFQINPHYLDANPEGHGGETREQRIEEFLEVNQDIYVAGLREGTMFRYQKGQLRLVGDRSCRIFKYGQNAIELTHKDDFNFLLK
ncbi:dipeptidase PepE [Halosquirtibacter xylanolyticus]|uniref:dipeptidase PepE n=1 Tax=Halosquirtibacter xylanolyticus TaxID=3374599 RepID=UPI00374A270F|nr:dipeptidase PepE [Prolixibacteraceae bacterium]